MYKHFLTCTILLRYRQTQYVFLVDNFVILPLAFAWCHIHAEAMRIISVDPLHCAKTISCRIYLTVIVLQSYRK